MTVEGSKCDAIKKAQFLAVSTDHSGDWVVGTPHSICGLKLDDEAVCAAVELRLGLNLGAPHTCRCAVTVDALGQHSLVCKKAPSRIARHQHLNDLVKHALMSAGVIATKKMVSLICRDGKCPNGMTQIPWRSGKLLVWDVTVVSNTAVICHSARRRGEVAEMAATRQCQKYSELSTAYTFLPIDFFQMLGRKIPDVSGDS